MQAEDQSFDEFLKIADQKMAESMNMDADEYAKFIATQTERVDGMNQSEEMPLQEQLEFSQQMIEGRAKKRTAHIERMKKELMAYIDEQYSLLDAEGDAVDSSIVLEAVSHVFTVTSLALPEGWYAQAIERIQKRRLRIARSETAEERKDALAEQIINF